MVPLTKSTMSEIPSYQPLYTRWHTNTLFLIYIYISSYQAFKWLYHYHPHILNNWFLLLPYALLCIWWHWNLIWRGCHRSSYSISRGGRESFENPSFFWQIQHLAIMEDKYTMRERMSGAINALSVSPDGNSVVVAGRESTPWTISTAATTRTNTTSSFKGIQYREFRDHRNTQLESWKPLQSELQQQRCQMGKQR